MSSNKRFLSFVSLILCIILINTGTLVNSDSYKGEDKKDIKGYDYPVKPGTSEWIQMEDKTERLKACQIPQDVLRSLTTDELIETVLNYPFLMDIYYFDSFQKGFEIVSENFNGLKELLSREDAAAKLLKKYKETEVIKSADKDNYKKIFNLSNIEIILRQNGILNKFNNNELKELENEVELKYLKKKENPDIYGITLAASYRVLAEKQDIPIGDDNSYIVYTPNGTPVQVVIRGELLSASEKTGCETEIKSNYPGVTILCSATTNYNCHSYAWYNQNTTNRYWMEDPSDYMTDGSYYKRNSGPSASDKIYYGTPGKEHSGIVTSVYGTNDFYVTSKWGYYNLVLHKYTDCPYYYSSTPISYFYR